MPKLSHTDLLKLGHKFGYTLNEGGLCHGFSCMLMQAILAQQETQFWQRLKLIEEYSLDFSLLLSKIEEVKLKIKDGQPTLTKQDIAFLEIPAFYEGVELYLSPTNHQDVFNKKDISQTSVEDIYSLVHSAQLEGNAISFPLDKTYACNKTSLGNYINDLEEIISKHPDLPIYCSA
jgi:hypothetical protein